MTLLAMNLWSPNRKNLLKKELLLKLTFGLTSLWWICKLYRKICLVVSIAKCLGLKSLGNCRDQSPKYNRLPIFVKIGILLINYQGKAAQILLKRKIFWGPTSRMYMSMKETNLEKYRYTKSKKNCFRLRESKRTKSRSRISNRNSSK